MYIAYGGDLYLYMYIIYIYIYIYTVKPLYKKPRYKKNLVTRTPFYPNGWNSTFLHVKKPRYKNIGYNNNLVIRTQFSQICGNFTPL